MKKIYTFALIFVTLLSCIIFSACGDKYANLEMRFYSSSGEALSSVNLVIGSNEELQTATIGVQFLGIDVSDIGEVQIYSTPSNLISVSNQRLENDTYYADISADLRGTGKLTVLHGSSGKTASIDLNVDRKSTSISTTDDTYIISIPDSGQKDILINSSELVSQIPNGSNDTVYFKVKNDATLQNVQFKYVNINSDNTLIEGFVIDENVQEGAELILYPVTYMQGYELTEYPDNEITVRFIKTLNSESVYLSTDEYHQEYLNNGETIYLIAKETDMVTPPDNKSYNFNNIHIVLQYLNDEAYINLDAGNINYYDYYDIVISTTNSNITYHNANNDLIIQAVEYTADEVQVTISLVPKNCVGDIVSINKTFTVKGEVKPTDIEVYMQGDLVDINYSVDLYDYYVSSGSALGALFNFNPIVEYSYSDLRNMRISIQPEILNAYILENDSYVGVNRIYTDDTFTTLYTNNEYQGYTYRDNKYVLEIYLNNQPLRFYFDNEKNTLVSEPFNSTNNLYIKYFETDILNDNYGLEIEVFTYYSGNYEYLQSISERSIEITFNRLEGVRSLVVNAGYLREQDGSYRETLYTDNNALAYSVSDLYLNRLEGTDADVHAYILYIGRGNVLGDRDRVLTNADFQISVSGGADNPLLLKQYSVDDGNGKDTADSAVQGESSINYTFDTGNGVYNAILLVYNSNTDIGDYTITFRHDNGYTLVLNCKVYQRLTAGDIGYNFEENNKAFRNSSYVDGEATKTYLYPNYISDYIVAAGQILNLEVVLDDQFNDEYVLDYNFTAEFNDVTVTSVSDYLSIERLLQQNNSINISFNQGTCIDNINRYVNLNIIVRVQNYSDIITINGYEEQSINLIFFIYEEIDEDEIVINYSSIDRYMYNYLGAYYKDQATVDLEIQILGEDNQYLWNYVQAYNQEDNYNIGITSQESTDQETGETYTNQYSVVWYTENADYVITDSQGDKNIELTFSAEQDLNATSYYRDIYAYVRQFNTTFTFRSRVTVHRPIISQAVSIESDVYYTQDTRQDFYIDLKAGEEYAITANTFSSEGEVTNNEIFMVIVDNQGNQNYNFVTIDNNTNTLHVRDVEFGSYTDLRLIVFAKDALNQIISQSTAGFDNISAFLMDGIGDENINAYKNAYVIINIYLTDGSQSNPYIINNADDFWEIKLDTDAHYRLMNNIDILNTTYTGQKVINDFTGSIETYQSNNVSYVYTLYGINLDNNNLNLFTNFSGQISNINFNVNYQYDLSIGTNAYLGVFDTNNGTLNNVSVVFSGDANINQLQNSAPYIYFGGLVGENRGDISYTSNSIVGSQGSIDLSGDANVYFGGLVGRNLANISGFDSSSETTLNANYSILSDTDASSDVIFSVYIANEGALADININSSMSNINSAVGGIIGINDYESGDIGRLSNAFVTGTISGLDNIGGVIGINRTPAISMTFNINNGEINSINQTENRDEPVYYVENVTSNVVINARNKVGGIVGLDDGGSYKEVHYQILTSTNTAIRANERVGGIAGSSHNGVFIYCSVMSYHWDFNALRLNNDYISAFAGDADIVGSNYVAGIVGFATNGTDNIPNNPTFVQGDNVGNTVVVQLSSVNASLYAETGTALMSDIAGILNNGQSSNLSVIYNAYFMGKLVGDIFYNANNDLTERMAISNNENVVFNSVYSVVVDGDNLVFGDYVNGFGAMLIGADTDNMNNWTSTMWGYDPEINGGYIYILNENGECLYQIAPTSLMATVKEDYQISDSVDNVIHLDYYNFILDNTAEDYTQLYNELNNRFNSHNLQDLFNFEYTPTNLDSVRIYAQSSNSGIIYINNGRLLVRGVGQCTITFISVLNTSIRTSVLVDVSYAIGNNLVISDSSLSSNNINGSEQNIANDKAKQYYIYAEGMQDYNGESYQYQANEDIYLRVEVGLSSADIGYQNIPDYLNISGVDYEEIDEENSKIIYIIEPGTPFSISVLQYLVDGYFTFDITPYTVVRYQDENYLWVEIENELLSGITSFNLYTRQGASDIALNYDAVVLYPNDTTTITAYVTTDIELSEEDLISDLIYSYSFYDLETGLDIDDINLSANIELIRNLGLDTDTGLQTIYYRLTINELSSNAIDTPVGLKVTYTLRNGENASIEFTILPQRINKLEIKNYIYTTDDSQTILQSNVLRPTGEGLIIIDIAPNNGYYDYLEISDVTGYEEIIFAQIDGVGGQRLAEMDQPSSDGTGIKLIKDYEGFNNTIYVATMISNTYSSVVHTIRVTAYLNSGEQVSETFYYEIDVKMLPAIRVDYLKPNGEVSYSKTDSSLSTDNQIVYVANAVDTRFRITTSNSDGNVDIEFLNSTINNINNNFEIIEDYNGYYTLRFRNENSNFVGESFDISFKTRATLENGDYEEVEVIINLKVVEFVIHDVSVTHSRTNSQGSTEIYGDYSVPILLEFYFDETDISYSYSNSFWDRVYRYDESINEENQRALYYINEILKALNTDRSINDMYNKYLSLSSDEDISLIGNTLEVLDGNIGTILNLNFILGLNEENYWEIYSLDDYVTTNISNERSADENVQFDYDYYLNFVNSNTYEEPEVIASNEDFLNMQAGENMHYILAQDLTFDEYVPLDINIKSFDGNGHTITINSFAQFNDETIYAGLFRQIYEGMIVMNLNVKYNTTNNGIGSYSFGQVSPSATSFNISNYGDICNNPDVNYSSAYFGAITPINNGIITNCSSSGYVALHASTIEAKTTGYNIEFYMGGLVAQNNNTGYITNSTSRLSMFALANIGGLAYSNSGKIVSSGFDANSSIFTITGAEARYSEGGLIYAYNNSVVNTSLVSVAGLVVDNSGEISMSYVNSGSTSLFGGSIGNISAKDISAGFVYSNTGTVYDSYVYLTRIGANNNRFSGFVNTNSGSIYRTYTYINEGNRNSSEVNMFAPTGTTGITDSYEIMIIPDGYNNGISGLTTIRTSIMTQQSSYPAFTFGDNESAVWYINSGSTPRLVVSTEIVDYNDNQVNTANMYYGIRNIRVEETTVEDEDGHVTVITTYEIINGTYGTQSNPYLIYDIDTWNYYFTNESNRYYRLICDIDFSSINGNPITSDYTFKGNIQGNNMDISGLMIYSGSSLDSIGLFKDMQSADDVSIKNSVRNLDLNIRSILATKTIAVGGLAGIIEDFNIYNIDINANDVIIVGANAVGGLAGIVRGDINIETITSNVGVNSTRASSGYRYAIYLSRNNGQAVSSNLSNVYYAGSVVGIVDAYSNANFNINSNRDINSTGYFDVKDINVSGTITAIGDTVGVAFGMIGERVRLDDVNIDLTAGSLSGAQYSAMAVGENRGIIMNSTVVAQTDNLFASSSNVSSGLVGLNLGGYIENASVNVNIIRSSGSSTVAGVIGRNLNGSIQNVQFDGDLLGYITGGIIGSNYDYNTFISRTSGAGAIETDCKVALPGDNLSYTDDNQTIDRISNVSLSINSVNYWLNNMRYFYTYTNDQNSFDEAVRASRVLGLLVGLSNAENSNYRVSLNSNYLKFEGSQNDTYIGLVERALLFNGNEEYDIPYSNVIDLDPTEYENTYVTYILGAVVSQFDAWNRETYSTARLVLTPETDKINAIDQVVVIGDNSSTINSYYIRTNVIETQVNDRIYAYDLILHTAYSADSFSFEMHYNQLLNYFDSTITEINIVIVKTDSAGDETHEEFSQELNTSSLDRDLFTNISIDNSITKIEISFEAMSEGELISYTYIFNLLN